MDKPDTTKNTIITYVIIKDDKFTETIEAPVYLNKFFNILCPTKEVGNEKPSPSYKVIKDNVKDLLAAVDNANKDHGHDFDHEA